MAANKNENKKKSDTLVNDPTKIDFKYYARSMRQFIISLLAQAHLPVQVIRELFFEGVHYVYLRNLATSSLEGYAETIGKSQTLNRSWNDYERKSYLCSLNIAVYLLGIIEFIDDYQKDKLRTITLNWKCIERVSIMTFEVADENSILIVPVYPKTLKNAKKSPNQLDPDEIKYNPRRAVLMIVTEDNTKTIFNPLELDCDEHLLLPLNEFILRKCNPGTVRYDQEMIIYDYVPHADYIQTHVTPLFEMIFNQPIRNHKKIFKRYFKDKAKWNLVPFTFS